MRYSLPLKKNDRSGFDGVVSTHEAVTYYTVVIVQNLTNQQFSMTPRLFPFHTN